METREIMLKCIDVFNIPIELPEESMSYSEKYKLEMCREFANKREVKVDLSVFDEEQKKYVQEMMIELSMEFGGKVSFINE